MAPVVTAVISDLHLGTRSRADVLRRPELRAILFEGLQEADEIVLLGDVIELRELPLPEALEAAFPFFEELGEALPGRRITVLAGNHDHHVVAEWLEGRDRLQHLVKQELVGRGRLGRVDPSESEPSPCDDGVIVNTLRGLERSAE